jgi:phytoene synthase
VAVGAMNATPSTPLDLNEAYAQCAVITRTEAKNFAYGIRLLPTEKRRAMEAVYALARRIDDIGDGADDVVAKLDALATVQHDIDLIDRGGHASDEGDAVMVAIADVARSFPLPLGAVGELIEGCRRDVAGGEYATADDLVAYCRLVAGSVGRLSLSIFGHRGGRELANRRADSLGVALQITNILRDIVEDREQLGRIYIPSDDIERFGCASDLSGPEDDVAGLIVYEAGRAREWYADGLALLPMLDHRSRACVAAMAGIYFRLLERIERDPTAVLRTRVSLPGSEKVLVAVSALAGRGVR